MSMDWYRRYTGTNSDPKLKHVAKSTGIHFCFVLALWDEILEHSNKRDERGSLEGFDLAVIATNLDLDLETVQKIHLAMHEGESPLLTRNAVTKFVTKNVTNRNETVTKTVTERNGAFVTKSNAQRQREFRERVKLQRELELGEDRNVTSNGRNALDKTREEENKYSEAKASSLCTEPEKIGFDFDSGKFQNIDDQHRLRWGEAYPALNIAEQIAKAASWLKANPKNRKSNYERFLVNWFSKAQDRAPGGAVRSFSFEEKSKEKTDLAIEEARKRYAQSS
jgi:hypothetical protein